MIIKETHHNEMNNNLFNGNFAEPYASSGNRALIF